MLHITFSVKACASAKQGMASNRLTRRVAWSGEQAHFGACAAGHRGVWDVDLARHINNGLAREVGRIFHHALAHCLVIHKQDGLQFEAGPVSTAQLELKSYCRPSTTSYSQCALMVLVPWLVSPMSVPDSLALQCQLESIRLN